MLLKKHEPKPGIAIDDRLQEGAGLRNHSRAIFLFKERTLSNAESN